MEGGGGGGEGEAGRGRRGGGEGEARGGGLQSPGARKVCVPSRGIELAHAQAVYSIF